MITVAKEYKIISKLEEALELLKKIPDFKNSEELFQKVTVQIPVWKKEEEIHAKRNKKITIISISAISAVIAFVIILNTVIIPTVKYNNAIKLMDGGEYAEAISVFEALEGYKDSEEKITDCLLADKYEDKYNEAVTLMNEGEYEDAVSLFETFEGYKDSDEKMTDCKYEVAVSLVNEEKYQEAIFIFDELGEYKDCVNKKEECKKIINNNPQVGNYIFYGLYEQDNNTSNGKEYIEWLVLEVKDGKALVISKYALDYKEYNSSATNVTWEICSLRKWLNNDFINTSFSPDEKAKISTVTLTADKDPEYSIIHGNETIDQVFLLSIKEADNYFASNSERTCKSTKYATYISTGKSDIGNCIWWLRSPGSNQKFAATVIHGGIISKGGYRVQNINVAVRPAMWIDLNS